MIKKLPSLVLAGALMLPTLGLADDLEDRITALEEKQESWDLSSRIQWNGDFRFRADYLTADTPSQYTALDVAHGVVDVLNSGQNGMPTLLGAFGLGMTDPLANLMGGLPADPTSFVTAATGAGLTTQQATDLAAIFYNPSVGALLTGMVGSNATIGDVAAAFGDVQSLVAFMKNVPAADRKLIFGSLYNQYQPDAAKTVDNDTVYTNRFRLNMRAKAMENLEFKARLAMYKAWGMQNNVVDYSENNGMGGGAFMLSSLGFDGSAARQPEDSILRVDRAFMNWNNIGDSPVWFSIGRRPVTDGPPNHVRLSSSAQKMATPIAYMDYPFDGLSLGYAYENLFGVPDLPGRVRLCYGRGFESGPNDEDSGLNDVDFGGISWDVFQKDNRFFNFQSFGAWNIFNVPDNVDFVNPLEYAMWDIASADTKGDYYDPLDPSKDLLLNRANLGDIYHTSAVYMSKFQDLHYFLTLGWSHTVARGVDELGTSLLGSWWDEPKDQDGYSTLLGVRYDMDDIGLKIGAEYNWGSEYWISFTPGHDDLYASKLATRGSVVELYAIYDIPAGEAISKFSQAFFRVGFQHYQYDYTGSGFWLGAPQDVDELAADPLAAQFYTAVESMDQVYVTMEAWF